MYKGKSFLHSLIESVASKLSHSIDRQTFKKERKKERKGGRGRARYLGGCYDDDGDGDDIKGGS